MLPGSPDPKDFGRYAAISQVGLEMVAPIVLGLILDRYLGWAPWALIGGAALGLFGGLAHLIHMAGQEDRKAAGQGGPRGADRT